MKLESIILDDFFQLLNQIGANYCVMNNYTELPEVIPSDVDFAIDINTFSQLDGLVMKLAKKHQVRITQKIWHGYNKCAFILSPLKTDKYFWLQLDFFVDFSGKGFPNLLPYEDMVKNKKKYKNFFIPAPEVEAPFLLQRRIFKSELKQKHIKDLQRLTKPIGSNGKEGVLKIFGKKIGSQLIEHVSNNDFNSFYNNIAVYRKKLKEISNNNTSFSYRCIYYTSQIFRGFYRLFYPTGISISLTGNLKNKDKFLFDLDQIISGSYHGTLTIPIKAKKDLIGLNLIKMYWAKVTKRKVFLPVIPEITTITLSKSLFRINPDLMFVYNSQLSKTENFNYEWNEKLTEFSYRILKCQAERTERHLSNSFSPTGKK